MYCNIDMFKSKKHDNPSIFWISFLLTTLALDYIYCSEPNPSLTVTFDNLLKELDQKMLEEAKLKKLRQILHSTLFIAMHCSDISKLCILDNGHSHIPVIKYKKMLVKMSKLMQITTLPDCSKYDRTGNLFNIKFILCRIFIPLGIYVKACNVVVPELDYQNKLLEIMEAEYIKQYSSGKTSKRYLRDIIKRVRYTRTLNQPQNFIEINMCVSEPMTKVPIMWNFLINSLAPIESSPHNGP